MVSSMPATHCLPRNAAGKVVLDAVRGLFP
jgi:hypothetical protein